MCSSSRMLGVSPLSFNNHEQIVHQQKENNDCITKLQVNCASLVFVYYVLKLRSNQASVQL